MCLRPLQQSVQIHLTTNSFTGGGSQSRVLSLLFNGATAMFTTSTVALICKKMLDWVDFLSFLV